MRTIEVFADIGCPFTHVGLRRFVALRRDLGRDDDVVLRVRSWPLEVVNGVPLDAHHIAAEVEDLRAQVAPDLFEGFREDAFPATSIPALALATAAAELDLRTGERVSLAVRTLLFEDGVDVADLDVLRSVAADHDVPWSGPDEALVLEEHALGLRRGVVGSPHFSTPEGDFFCPALDISRGGDGHFRIRPDDEGFERFLRACFT